MQRQSVRRHSTDLVARGPPLQQQTEAVGRLLVVFQALTQAPIIILHQSPVHYHFQLAWKGEERGTTALDAKPAYRAFRRSVDKHSELSVTYERLRYWGNDDKRISSVH